MRLRVYPAEKLLHDWRHFHSLRVWPNRKYGITIKFHVYTRQPLGWFLAVGTGRMGTRTYKTQSVRGIGQVARSILELKQATGVLRMEIELMWAMSQVPPLERAEFIEPLRLLVKFLK